MKNDKPSTFEHLLQANKERTTDQKNVQVLMVEVFKMINDFAPPIMEDFFLFHKNTHNIRNFEMISNESKKTVRYGLETAKHRALLLWVNLPEKYKTAASLNSFKTKTKTWKCQTCLCPLCQTYLKYLEFIYVVFSVVFSSPFQPSVALLHPLKASENAIMSWNKSKSSFFSLSSFILQICRFYLFIYLFVYSFIFYLLIFFYFIGKNIS